MARSSVARRIGPARKDDTTDEGSAMRGERFDDLVKSQSLTTGGTRRRLIGLVAGLIVGTPRAQVTASPAACLPGDAPCAGDDACCSGVCTMHGRCGCFDTGHLCPDDGYCCGGVCLNHRCT